MIQTINNFSTENTNPYLDNLLCVNIAHDSAIFTFNTAVLDFLSVMPISLIPSIIFYSVTIVLVHSGMVFFSQKAQTIIKTLGQVAGATAIGGGIVSGAREIKQIALEHVDKQIEINKNRPKAGGTGPGIKK
jgi:hypothetical protein